MSTVRLEYHRPPDRTDVFEQTLVTVDRGCHVTLLDHIRMDRDKVIDDRVALEPGASIVWFTFEGAWHDIGRFHTADGAFTGYYANVIVPVTFDSPLAWRCTDLFLDVWLGANGVPKTLDEDELANAVENGWVTDADAERARIEVEHIRAAVTAGIWPPIIARQWTVEAARANI